MPQRTRLPVAPPAASDDGGWETVTDPNEARKVVGVADARKIAERQAAARRGPQAAGTSDNSDAPIKTPTGQAAQAAFTKVGAARAMLQQLARVRQLYDKDFSGAGLSGLKEYNPLRPENQTFDGAVSQIPLLARQAFRVAGSGADSDRELNLIMEAMPDRKAFDRVNQERFKSLDTTLRSFIRNYGPLAGYSPEQLQRLQREHQYGSRLPTARPSASGQRRANPDAIKRRYNLK